MLDGVDREGGDVKENVSEAAAENRADELGCEKLLLGFDVK